MTGGGLMNDAGTVTWHGSRAALRQLLLRLPARMAADPGLGRALAAEVLRLAAEEFWAKAKGGTDSFGIRWKPWSAGYAKSQRGKPRLDGIGLKTGRLWRSLDPHSPEAIVQSLGRQAIAGTRVPYASYFHRVRPLWREHFARLPPKWQQRLSEAAARYALTLLQREGMG